MKKILSLLLALAMCLSVASFSAVADEDAIRGIGQAELTNALGITDFTEDMLGDGITRQEFAKILYKLVTGTELNEESKETCVFSDVTDAAYIPYVNAMYKTGIIGGFTDGTFKGENTLTGTETVTFLIRALGYDVIAAAKGGYPTGYLTEARGLGLMRDFEISVSEPLTKGDAAILIKNALVAETEVRDTYTSDGSVEFSGKKTTLLYSIFGVLKEEGVVEGIDITRLYGDSTVPPWHIEINGKTYDIGETSPNHLLGMTVNAYYFEENDTLVYIEEKEGRNKTAVIYNDRVLSIADNIIIADEGNGKTKEYSFGKLTHIVYNNSATEDVLSMELVSGFDGNITLIDNNSDNEWDVIKVEAAKDIVVDYVDSIERAVYDKNSGEKFVLDSRNVNPFVQIEDVNGKRVNIGMLKTNDVLTLYESRPDASQGYIRALYSDKKKDAVIDGMFEQDGRGYITSGTETYTTTRECYAYSVPRVTLGEQVTLLLNAEGKVAGIDFFNAGKQQYGQLIKLKLVKSGIEDKALLRIMNRYGVVNETEFAGKVTVDGISYENTDSGLFAHLKAASEADIGATHESVYTQLFKYSVDDFGKVNTVDTVIDNINKRGEYVPGNGEDIISGNILYKGTNGSGTYYSDAKNIMGGVVVSNDTVIFIRPPRNLKGEENADIYGNEENYGVKSSLSGTSYSYSSFYEDISKISASAITINESANSTTSAYNTTFSVFDSLSLSVDEDGVSCYKVYFWQDGNRKSRLANKEAVFSVTGEALREAMGLSGYEPKDFTADKLKPGDVFRYSTDNYGKISGYEFYYRADGNIKVSEKSATSWSAYERLTLGYVYRTYSDGLSFVQSDSREYVEGTSKIEYMKDPACAILVYDSSKPLSKRLSVGTAKDARAYSRYTEDCSVMFLQSKYGNPRAIYIIR